MSAPGYSKAGLIAGIEHAKKNIAVLEGAIEKERDTIVSYRRIIASLDERDKAAQSGVEIEVVR